MSDKMVLCNIKGARIVGGNESLVRCLFFDHRFRECVDYLIAQDNITEAQEAYMYEALEAPVMSTVQVGFFMGSGGIVDQVEAYLEQFQ